MAKTPKKVIKRRRERKNIEKVRHISVPLSTTPWLPSLTWKAMP